MLRRPAINLNKQSQDATILLIREVLSMGIQLSEVLDRGNKSLRKNLPILTRYTLTHLVPQQPMKPICRLSSQESTSL